MLQQKDVFSEALLGVAAMYQDADAVLIDGPIAALIHFGQ